MEKVASGFGLIEGPVWDQTRGLIFSDVPNGGVYRLSRRGEIETVVEHRRGIGGLALHEAGEPSSCWIAIRSSASSVSTI